MIRRRHGVAAVTARQRLVAVVVERARLAGLDLERRRSDRWTLGVLVLSSLMFLDALAQCLRQIWWGLGN